VEMRIRNQWKQLLLVPLSSRGTLHLAPGELSLPVHESEITRNDKVSQLAKRGLIKIQRVETEK